MKKNNLLTGLQIGAFLTASLIAVFYLGWKLFGLPFVPFDFFDWLARMLPGAVVTFGIDSLVSIIRSLNLGDTAETAKIAEKLIAIALFFVASVVSGVILFAVQRFWEKFAFLLGIIWGAAIGMAVLIVSLSLNRAASVSPFLGGVWILAMFFGWGALLGWSYNRLRGKAEAAKDSEKDDAKVEKDSVKQVDRRKFLLKLGGATASVTVVGAVVGSLVPGRRDKSPSERWSASNVLPNSNAPLQPAPGTRPELTPLENHYRVDINTVAPEINEQNWRLKISGLVEQPLELKLEEIRRYEPLHQFITLSCISNPVAGDLIGTTRWTGVSLQKILPDWKLQTTATDLKITSADGFFESLPLDAIRADERIMLSYAWDGVPLLTTHGFPLRIYIPDIYGMKQPKWIVSIEATAAAEPGYWVVRGWDTTARMETTSIIDAVATEAKFTDANGQIFLPIGGIAHAGARGISKVEVRVDEDNWQLAQLRQPLSETTWVFWRYDFPFQAGEHTFTVRCFDGRGALQKAEPSAPHPDGATGYHSRATTL